MKIFTALGKKKTSPYLSLVYPIAAIISFNIIGSDIRAQTFLQLLAFLAVFIIIYHRYFLNPISNINQAIAIAIEFTPVVFFVYLLVLSTGGITSQFLILTHLFSLGIVFLLGLFSALIYSGVTISMLLAHLLIDPNGQLLWQQNPYLVILYLVAFLAIIPFDYLLARYHYFREEWVDALTKQVATSKLQEAALLATINDAVIAIDTDLKIVLANKAAQDLTNFTEAELFGKPFFPTFNLKDSQGEIITEENLPFQRLIGSKASITERSLHLSKKEKTFVEIDLKVSPIIDSAQNVQGLMLVAKDVSKLTEVERLTGSLTELSFRRFSQIVTVVRKHLDKLIGIKKVTEADAKQSLDLVVQKNQELMRFTNDFLLSLKIDSGEVSGIVSIIDLYPVVSKTLTDAEKITAKFANINFIPQDVTPNIIPIRGKKILPAIKKELPVLADSVWLQEALTKILFISVELSNNNQVDVSLEEVEGDAKITFSFTTFDFPYDKKDELFAKFYGELAGLSQLTSTSGFEIYIANELLQRIGGNLSVSQDQKAGKMLFITKIPRAPHTKEQSA